MTHSTISLGVGLGGGKSATSSGRLPSGGGGFNIDVRDTHSNILARTGDPVGAIAFGTDTYDLYVYDGALWVWYDYDSSTGYSNTMSASFDGTNDYLTATLSSQVFDGDYSISFWFNADDTPTYTSLLQLGTDSGYNDGWRLYRYSSGLSIGLWKGQGGYSAIIPADGSTPASQWHHVAITRSGSDLVMYLNGSAIETGTDSTAYTSTAFNIGFTTYPFDGFMDEVALWDSALTASEISAIYNSGTPTDLVSLEPVHWWRMGDGTGDTDSGGGAPANADTIGTVVDKGSGGSNATNPNGALYSSTTP